MLPVLGKKAGEKIAAEPAATNDTEKKLAKPSTAASGMKNDTEKKLAKPSTAASGMKNDTEKKLAKPSGMKKVVKKLFLTSKRKRSRKEKTDSGQSTSENEDKCSTGTSNQLETLIKCEGDTTRGLGEGDTTRGLGEGDTLQVPRARFVTERLQTWMKAFQGFYQEQHVKGVVCAPTSSQTEGGTEICIKKDRGGVGPTDWVVICCSGSEVVLRGRGLEEWERDDFPALTDRVGKTVAVKPDKEVILQG